MRLQKFMADAGVASRRKCEELISAGLVKVNGATATLGMSVEPSRDAIEYDGKRLRIDPERVVLMLNKPRGVMCTASDPEGRATVMDYFEGFPHRLYNVGRLDYDSEGLVIMTNDGELAYRLMHPSYTIDKTYYCICDGELSRESAAALQNGVELDDGVTSPARVGKLKLLPNGNTGFTLTIHEGRNRQVRRMLEAVGHKTLLLRRIKVGSLELGTLERGKWRYVTEDEIRAIEGTLR